MEEEAYELGNYLPLSFKTPSEQEYIDFDIGDVGAKLRIEGKCKLYQAWDRNNW